MPTGLPWPTCDFCKKPLVDNIPHIHVIDASKLLKDDAESRPGPGLCLLCNQSFIILHNGPFDCIRSMQSVIGELRTLLELRERELEARHKRMHELTSKR